MKKITFPGLWTNTCCSHPRHTLSELENSTVNGFIGLRRAAARRANFELGITDLNEESDLKVGSRILYYADACDKFAEHEVDYIIFSQKDIPHEPNTDEIMNSKYVSFDDFDDFLKERKEKYNEGITPWFKLLIDR